MAKLINGAANLYAMQPLVSVICLCHNHKPYLEEAMGSVLAQGYSNIEVIVVDDASDDGSKAMLEKWCKEQNFPFIDLPQNVGNCTAFNKGFSQSRGKYIIDFSTDDVMLPNRIEKQVKFFEMQEANVGVIFSNAQIVDEGGKHIRLHYAVDANGNIKEEVPEGDVYSEVLSRYFISPPTMMIRREVLADLDGYDESLAYEDFDFWVRSARKYQYAFQPSCLTKVRRVKVSLSSKLYTKGDRQLESTYRVCLKAADMNRGQKEKMALIKRVRYEMRHAVLTGNSKEALLFFGLLKSQQGINFSSYLFYILHFLNLPLKPLRNLYLSLRYSG